MENAIAGWPEITTLRLGVVDGTRSALAFWRRHGYRETGEVKPAGSGIVAPTRVLQKPLERGARA